MDTALTFGLCCLSLQCLMHCFKTQMELKESSKESSISFLLADKEEEKL